MNKEFISILEETKNTLTFLREIGYNAIDLNEESLKILESWGKPTLKTIENEVGKCHKCKRAKNIVFGEGDPNAKLIFIGNAPGNEEEKTGKPIAGETGALLKNIITAIGLSPESVYITNIIKCRPENDLKPTPNQIKACFPFLKQQIESIKPKFICTLGNSASHTLLNTSDSIYEIHGKFYEYNGIKVIPTFHPAELIADPSKKRSVWEDMKKLINEIKKS